MNRDATTAVLPMPARMIRADPIVGYRAFNPGNGVLPENENVGNKIIPIPTIQAPFRSQVLSSGKRNCEIASMDPASNSKARVGSMKYEALAKRANINSERASDKRKEIIRTNTVNLCANFNRMTITMGSST